MKRLLFFLFVPLMLFVSCSTSTPDNLLDEETYINIFVEMAVLDQYDPLLMERETRDELQQEILDRYGVTYEEFRISHNYYEQFVQDQIQRTNRASELLRAERDSIYHYENEYRNQKRIEELAREQEAENDQSPNN